MKLSLPLRLFLVHLVFSVGAAAMAVLLVGDAFDRYKKSWDRAVETMPAESLFQPFANEVARSLLLRLEQETAEEVHERDRGRISAGLNVLLKELPSLESVVIVDREGRIQYASDASVVDLGFTGDDDTSLLAATEPVRRQVRVEGPGELTQMLVPVFDLPGADAAVHDRRRLGSLIVLYRPDPGLLSRVRLERPSVGTWRYVLPVTLFLGAVAGSGVLIALFTGLPVRRLDRALRDFRARGFRGKLAIDRRGLGDFADAVNAIREMGGRLEALDARGRERDALLATLAQSLEEGMIALGPDGAPVAWNAAALRILTGHAAPNRETEQDTESAGAGLTRALEENPELLVPGQSSGISKWEIELRGPAGRGVPVRVTQIPFEVRPGEPGSLVLLRDLATLKQVEGHLLEAGRFAGLAHVAAGLAHEIRNPLHAIGLNAGVVEQYVDMERTEPRRRAMAESLTSIKDETRRLSDLLNTYLGLVRPERGAGPVDLRDLCRRVLRLVAYSASQSGVEIRLEGSSSLPPVEGIASRLQQAILNLVLNSIQAMPEGGVVTLETVARDDIVQLTVADTGPGLPLDREQDVFEMRMTTKPQGTGFGLPLVRMIAEAHGGRITYRRRGGGGAAMILRLPVRAAA